MPTKDFYRIVVWSSAICIAASFIFMILSLGYGTLLAKKEICNYYANDNKSIIYPSSIYIPVYVLLNLNIPTHCFEGYITNEFLVSMKEIKKFSENNHTNFDCYIVKESNNVPDYDYCVGQNTKGGDDYAKKCGQCYDKFIPDNTYEEGVIDHGIHIRPNIYTANWAVLISACALIIFIVMLRYSIIYYDEFCNREKAAREAERKRKMKEKQTKSDNYDEEAASDNEEDSDEDEPDEEWDDLSEDEDEHQKQNKRTQEKPKSLSSNKEKLVTTDGEKIIQMKEIALRIVKIEDSTKE